MLVEGRQTVSGASPAEVFDALSDPAVLARTLPGCRELSVVDDSTYELSLEAGVGAALGTYAGRVSIEERDPPGRYVASLNVRGGPGAVRARLSAQLEPEEGGAAVAYRLDAELSGSVAAVGQRVLAGVAKKQAGEFFRALERDLHGAPAAVDQPDAAAGEPRVYTGPGAGAGSGEQSVRWLVRGALLGSLLTLAGFAAGRRSR